MFRKIPFGALEKLYQANIFSLLLIFKFGILFAYTWAFSPDLDLFGHYTLAFGLTNSFFILAGMRARFYVMKAVERLSQLFQVFVVMAALGLVAGAAVYWLNLSSALLPLIMFVAAAKFVEMFLDANTSFLQRMFGRKEAFRLINQHGYFVAIAFMTLVPLGLEWAVLAEFVLLMVAVLRQCLRWLPLAESRSGMDFSELVAVLRGGIAYTLAAGLNSAQLTVFLYFAQAMYTQPAVLMVSKIFAAQAVFGRLITGNNFYFKSSLDAAIRRLSRHMIWVSIATLVALAEVLWLTKEYSLSVPTSLIGVGLVFTVINVMNVLIRQHVMIVAGVGDLIVIQSIELALLTGAMIFLPVGPALALAGLTVLRMWRIDGMKRIAVRHANTERGELGEARDAGDGS